MVRVAGFAPAASSIRTRRSPGLSYTLLDADAGSRTRRGGLRTPAEIPLTSARAGRHGPVRTDDPRAPNAMRFLLRHTPANGRDGGTCTRGFQLPALAVSLLTHAPLK